MRFRSKLYRRHRRRELAVFALLVLGLLVVKVLMPEPEPSRPAGIARVIDADSLMVGGVEVRLRGIDAPELDQQCRRGGAEWDCGREAARRLRALTARASVACEGSRFDQHGRLLALCRLGELEINRWLVEQGWALS